MPSVLLILLSAAAGLASDGSAAAPIDFRDYLGLETGMTEGEILVRVGAPDHESIVNNDFYYRKTWYYLPDGSYSGDRITTIEFDAGGRVIYLERE